MTAEPPAGQGAADRGAGGPEAAARGAASHGGPGHGAAGQGGGGHAEVRALAVTVSNRAAAGVYEDRSGPVLVGLLAEAGCMVDGPLVVPDGSPVEMALWDAINAGYHVVVTTGGTGLTPGDLTPEMTRRVLDREIPGIAEAI
ncbi:MAG TPA: molybdopterin-binding protein, partial [Streptosporangiaceae bacterium]|nr:molybdopterin-binding protein [Streptosporangiaceae bacterium]